jgi:hypothetical protein
MILIVESGEEEKNVLGDLRRIRTAKFEYRLPSKRTLGQRAPRGKGRKKRSERPQPRVVSIHLE